MINDYVLIILRNFTMLLLLALLGCCPQSKHLDGPKSLVINIPPATGENLNLDCYRLGKGSYAFFSAGRSQVVTIGRLGTSVHYQVNMKKFHQTKGRNVECEKSIFLRSDSLILVKSLLVMNSDEASEFDFLVKPAAISKEAGDSPSK